MAISDVNLNSPAISRSQQPSLAVSEFFSTPSSYSLPCSLSEFTSRIRKNLNYFGLCYVVILCFMLLFRIIFHPHSIQQVIVVLILWVSWRSLYMRCNNDQVVVLNRSVDNRLLLVVLVILTAVALVLAGLWLTAVIGLGILAMHAALRISEDLFLDEQEAAEGGLLSAVDSKDGPWPDPIVQLTESPLVL